MFLHFLIILAVLKLEVVPLERAFSFLYFSRSDIVAKLFSFGSLKETAISFKLPENLDYKIF
jgi:hypothetical protein